MSPVASSSDDEDLANINDPISLNRLFDELQNAQANISGTRMENRDIHQQLSKLTKRIAHIGSLFSSVI